MKINELSEDQILKGLTFTFYRDSELISAQVVYIYQSNINEPKYVWFRDAEKKLDYFLDNHADYEVLTDDAEQIIYNDNYLTENDNYYQQDENAIIYYQKEKAQSVWKKMEKKYVDLHQDLNLDLLNATSGIHYSDGDDTLS